MSFRVRLLLALAGVVLLPLGVFAVGIRQTVADRLVQEFERRVETLASAIDRDLAREGERLAARLEGLAQAAQADNRFRAGVARGVSEERSYVLDYGGRAMRLAGLDLLQIQDADGRILSSGHFRNEYDRLEPELPRLLGEAPRGVALVRARSPDGPFLALTRAEAFALGGRELTVVGGIGIARDVLTRLAPPEELTAALIFPGGVLTPAGDSAELDPTVSGRDRVVREIRVPYIDAAAGAARLSEARVVVSHPLTALKEVRRSVDRWFLVALAVTGALAVVLAGWISARMSRPLTTLARKTAAIDLDALDVDFASDRRDEFGDLGRLLGAMTDRLQVSAGRLREAERLAAMGELARQVNHDIKNGLVPIRNVLRHLSQVARDDPPALPAVFEERRTTLESAIGYLETLARQYAKLSPRLDRVACDVNAVVQEVLRHVPRTAGVEVRTGLSEALPTVHADPVVLQRILENLVGNAVDGCDGTAGVVTVSTGAVLVNGQATSVRLTVADTGRGMTPAEVEQAFEHFVTTKPGGTGLGLSIVRRLVLDLGGTLRVETERGAGSRFIVELPVGEGMSGGSAAP